MSPFAPETEEPIVIRAPRRNTSLDGKDCAGPKGVPDIQGLRHENWPLCGAAAAKTPKKTPLSAGKAPIFEPVRALLHYGNNAAENCSGRPLNFRFQFVHQITDFKLLLAPPNMNV
jgi:hypothetical protein